MGNKGLSNIKTKGSTKQYPDDLVPFGGIYGKKGWAFKITGKGKMRNGSNWLIWEMICTRGDGLMDVFSCKTATAKGNGVKAKGFIPQGSYSSLWYCK